MISRRALLLQAAAAPLFDGDMVDGWTVVDGPESAFALSGGEIIVAEHASLPCWLRSGREFENFELRGEFLLRGWTDSGVYLRTPEHGRPSQAGFQIKVFHRPENPPTPYSVGAVFPYVAPSATPVREGWNNLRIRFDGPRLQVWINDTAVQDLDVEKTPELSGRLRRGYLGIVGASTPCRFRDLRVKELPGTETLVTLYEDPPDYAANWVVSEGKPVISTLGKVLRADGSGHFRTKEQFRDFELMLYVRGAPQHNSGIIFRSNGRGQQPRKDYEIQLHSVEEAHFPTGSLYDIKRAKYPRIEDGKWYLMQLHVKDRYVRVRVDGETVMEYEGLDNLDPGYIVLQAHRTGYWTEFKHIKLRRM